jgi:4-hydroxy-4-methyl-2-oxoglutarate aldolase
MLGDLTSAHIADACIRLGVPVRCTSLPPALPGMRAAGAVRPVRHYGSVDVFLEAIDAASPGDVLVVDNGGRRDEACIGDLITLEAQGAGLAGIAIWGLHRDHAEIARIGLPLFSLGAIPTGPERLDPQAADAFVSARIGDHIVTLDDYVLADGDGVIFVPTSELGSIVRAASVIRDAEQRQARRSLDGTSLRAQLAFREYLARRSDDPGYTFRNHLRNLSGAIEE